MGLPGVFGKTAVMFLITVALLGLSSQAHGDVSAGRVVKLPEKDRQALAILGQGVVGKALPALPLNGTVRLIPLQKGEWVYRLTAGAHMGARQNVLISRKKGTDDRHLWRLSIRGDTTEFLSLDGEGTVNLISEIDLKQDVITHYAPMLPLMFDGMKPGEASTVETAVKVFDIHDPTHVKYQGRLNVAHTYVGAYEVTVPAGTYKTVLIRSSYEGKVGPAHVSDGGYTFYAEGVGIVASLERMHVTAFLFYDKTTRTPKVLLPKQ